MIPKKLPKLVAMAALRKFTYDKRALVVGDTFFALEKDARILALLKRAAPDPADGEATSGRAVIARRRRAKTEELQVAEESAPSEHSNG